MILSVFVNKMRMILVFVYKIKSKINQLLRSLFVESIVYS